MKKIISMLTAVVLAVFVCACGKEDDNKNIYNSFKSFIAQNGTEENYYIQISKTANAANTLTEASRLGEDCAFMEYDVSGSLKFFRDDELTEISQKTYYLDEKSDAKWSDFEYDKLYERYRSALNSILESDAEWTLKKSKIENKNMPYSINIQYAAEQLDTKSIFSNSGNFGIVSVKFQTDKEYKSFNQIAVSCQYDYNDVIYLYSVTFGTPQPPDSDGNDGHRPEDIEKIFNTNKEQIQQQIEAQLSTAN